MSKTLIIAEKPSVAQTLASVFGVTNRHDGYLEGNGYIVSWCIGHMVELASADHYDNQFAKWSLDTLPILPDHFEFVVSDAKKKQFSILKKLMNSSEVEKIVCATDAGREGQSIFGNIYRMAGCKKPVLRLWISSMEDQAILDGFANLHPNEEFDNLYASALARSEADWLVGINGTRLFTSLYHSLHRVGRVQTPVLAMLVERQNAIQNFVKEPYWNVQLQSQGITFTSIKYKDRSEAEALRASCDGKSIKITEVYTEKKTISPPKLYDLTLLQRECNRLYGYTAQQVLDTTQSLYEKKLCTYPRTDSNFLTTDMEDSTHQLLSICALVFPDVSGLPEQPDVKRCINNARVTDHHAILPTKELQNTDLSSLSEKESVILRQISIRLLSATAEKHIYKETHVTAECCREEFTAKGKTVLSMGWKAIEKERRVISDSDESEPVDLPLIQEGDLYPSCIASLSEHFTTSPKSYTEDSLLLAMEHAGKEEFDADTEKKGLGTPATRAGILEKLVKSGYVKRKGKSLIPTEEGIHLIKIVPDTLKSVSLTAEWENHLMQIERGEMKPEEFMDGIRGLVSGLVSCYQSLPPEERTAIAPTDNTTSRNRSSNAKCIGPCPWCASEIREGKKNYYCSNKECSFCLWKDNKWLAGMKQSITGKMAAELVKDGKTFVKNLHSRKTDKTFSAWLILGETTDSSGKRMPSLNLKFPKVHHEQK